MDKLQELKEERDNLREETRNKEIHIWKFWEIKKDRILLEKIDRIWEINNILEGAELYKEKLRLTEKKDD